MNRHRLDAEGGEHAADADCPDLGERIARKSPTSVRSVRLLGLRDEHISCMCPSIFWAMLGVAPERLLDACRRGGRRV